ncbi:hypothetical protein CAC42_44 [Sphaceloma murrayae]|uniref:Carboxylic ester hydrolase n=1 Tax=Sphaceloma murrayae TaxID=2082308 RepID=A0A2K1QSG1_9PEZI|nr:hypothetical protein CAC42_44 [Sphaceloma murrayae]
MKSVLLFCLAACGVALAAPAATSAGCSAGGCNTPVNTTNGLITGHPAAARPRVIEYLGVPYAAPPVGDLRFAPPEPFAGNGPLVASSFGPRCPQTPGRPVAYPDRTPQAQQVIGFFAGQSNYTTSEDCLTLNVWTRPTPKAHSKAKPILVFFYGGRWSIGDTISPFYTGKYLADAEDVIVVTVNYRINIFGFPGAPGTTKNIAFLDQRRAVEWVSKNAAAFGGDARKITISGQSSGSVAVDYWSYRYVDDPLVAGYISHSGNAFSFPTNDLALAEKNWYNVTDQLGCGSSGDVVPCMRTKSMTEILAAVSRVRAPPTGSLTRTQPAFQPTVDGEAVLTVEEYTSRLKSGHFSKKPYLFINNENEAGYYKVPAFAQGNILPESDWQEFNGESFTCPNTFESFYRSGQDVPIWLARYFGDWDNIRLYPTSGAYHGSDLQMIFGASEDVSGLPEVEEQRRTKALMQRAWAAFADDPVNGLTTLGWPRYNRDSASVIELARNNSGVAHFATPQTFDAVCPSLNLTFYDIP